MIRIDLAHQISLIILWVGLLIFQSCSKTDHSYEIPGSEPSARPWTRWWWMGSSVTREGITRHLESFKEKGLGGVEIVPIYGEKGDEENFIPYLSESWIAMFLHTLREARRLDMQVDLALGSGWPMGGPWVPERYAARKFDSYKNPGGIPTRQRVKRAAPGAEGWVVDPFNHKATGFFLHRFDSLIAAIRDMDLPLRAVFNDSYEVYGADWTLQFPDEFIKRRGYDLLNAFPGMLDSLHMKSDQGAWSDYHQTIHELLLESCGMEVREWCDSLGVYYRYQAHGSPANLLDCYAEAHIPETESFGSSAFSIPGLSYDPDYEAGRFSRPDPLIMKFASSAAHITGKTLVSAETGTWLGNHFKVSLSQVKPQVDELFTSGINHVFYHGIAYSPFDKPFPGRLFYASTNFGPSSALWSYMYELNKYITNCQRLLQHINPGNDLLVYYPVFDLWRKKGPSGNILMQDIHNPDNWLYKVPFGQLIKSLWDQGYAFDYVSDKQLDDITKGRINLAASYRVLLIPEARVIPFATLKNILSLSEGKMKVIFMGLPSRVPGHVSFPARMDSLNNCLHTIRESGIDVADRTSLTSRMQKYGIRPLCFEAEGMSYFRGRHEKGDIFFIANLGPHCFDRNLDIPGKFKSAEFYDPEGGDRGFSPVIDNQGGKKIRLQLLPGETIFLITYESDIIGKPWHYDEPDSGTIKLTGEWELHFSDSLIVRTDSLLSWPLLPYTWAPYYTGTARYVLRFKLDQTFINHKRYILDLGEVHEMATVWLNGEIMGKTWYIPHRLEIPASCLQLDNTLILEVTNLDANRIVLLDREKVPWKNFYDINLVDITYRPFDASSWDPLPSGLLGPVRLIPLLVLPL